MLDILLWIVIVVLFILSFAGIIFPMIPSVIAIWIGFLLYSLFLHPGELNAFFWVAMIVLTLFLLVADIVANSYFVKRFGGSKRGERAAAVAVIVGSFIYPPFGIIIIPFFVVLLVELLQRQSVEKAFRSSIGSFIGFLSGSVAKVVVQLIMIIWFFIAV